MANLTKPLPGWSSMTDPRHAILDAGDKFLAMLLVEDMKCEADDVRQVLKGIRDDMESELDNARNKAA